MNFSRITARLLLFTALVSAPSQASVVGRACSWLLYRQTAVGEVPARIVFTDRNGESTAKEGVLRLTTSDPRALVHFVGKVALPLGASVGALRFWWPGFASGSVSTAQEVSGVVGAVGFVGWLVYLRLLERGDVKLCSTQSQYSWSGCAIDAKEKAFLQLLSRGWSTTEYRDIWEGAVKIAGDVPVHLQVRDYEIDRVVREALASPKARLVIEITEMPDGTVRWNHSVETGG